MRIFDTEGTELHDTRTSKQEDIVKPVDLAGCYLRKATMEGSFLPDANLKGADLRGADLYFSILYRADLSGADLRDANLCGVDLKESMLKGADLRNANLGLNKIGGPAQLQGACLLGAQLSGAILTGAKYDARTIFPDGFNPQLAGMLKVG